jgi:hypothetical protein
MSEPAPHKPARAVALHRDAREVLERSRRERRRQRAIAKPWATLVGKLRKVADALRDVAYFARSGVHRDQAVFRKWVSRFLTAGALLRKSGLAPCLDAIMDEAAGPDAEATVYAASLYALSSARDRRGLVRLLKGLREVEPRLLAGVLAQLQTVAVLRLRR